jgi:hypothetical protein
LAKKLKDCGVFGVSSDEYLNYALKNRQEWEDRGLEVVAGIVKGTEAKLLSEKKAVEAAPMVELKHEVAAPMMTPTTISRYLKTSHKN